MLQKNLKGLAQSQPHKLNLRSNGPTRELQEDPSQIEFIIIATVTTPKVQYNKSGCT